MLVYSRPPMTIAVPALACKLNALPSTHENMVVCASTALGEGSVSVMMPAASLLSKLSDDLNSSAVSVIADSDAVNALDPIRSDATDLADWRLS